MDGSTGAAAAAAAAAGAATAAEAAALSSSSAAPARLLRLRGLEGVAASAAAAAVASAAALARLFRLALLLLRCGVGAAPLLLPASFLLLLERAREFDRVTRRWGSMADSSCTRERHSRVATTGHCACASKPQASRQKHRKLQQRSTLASEQSRRRKHSAWRASQENFASKTGLREREIELCSLALCMCLRSVASMLFNIASVDSCCPIAHCVVAARCPCSVGLHSAKRWKRWVDRAPLLLLLL